MVLAPENLNPIDKKIANEINMGTLGALTIIKDKIENDLKLGNPVRYKEIKRIELHHSIRFI